jgi:predicted PurR-regulated permease PerM
MQNLEIKMNETKYYVYWIWVTALIVIISFLFFVSNILMPFVVGLAVAYFLDPLADGLERFGLSRAMSTILIMVLFFATVVLVLVLLFPLLQDQFVRLLDKLPSLVQNFEHWLEPIKTIVLAGLPPRELVGLSNDSNSYGVSLKELAGLSNGSNSYGASVVEWFGGILTGILRGGIIIFNAFSLILVTPVVSFYLLRDWDKIVAKIDGWLPLNSAPSIRIIAGDIDSTIAGFVRGQGSVCLLLSIFYGIALTSIELDFGLIIGIATGLISFVPYFGMLLGMAVALVIVISQYGEFLQVVILLFVFGIGQVIESMFLTPKLVGEKVGLHGVWVIFALMVGGGSFGFTGLLLAVPVAATIGVLVRFSISRYLESTLYSDPSNRD